MSGKTDSRMRQKSIYLSKPTYLTCKYKKTFSEIISNHKASAKVQSKIRANYLNVRYILYLRNSLTLMVLFLQKIRSFFSSDSFKKRLRNSIGLASKKNLRFRLLKCPLMALEVVSPYSAFFFFFSVFYNIYLIKAMLSG